jgi:membrane associated rhomboid family serine protease
LSLPDRKFAVSLDATRVLVGLNLLVFAAMVLSSSLRTCFFPSQDLLLRWGANLGALTVHGEYWRLFTSIFIHAGILHLGLNMYALWVFGPTVAKTFGTGRFLAVYFLSGLSGALASTVWNPAQTSAGASGALVGTAGAMLAAMVLGAARDEKARGFVQPLVFFAVICASLLYGFFIPQIDNAAHIGGLAGGFLCGLALLPGRQPKSKLWQAYEWTALSLVVFVVMATCLLEARADKRSTTYRVALRAMADLKANRYQAAFDGYDELLKSELNTSYFVGRADALVGLKKYESAIADCKRAMAMNPRDPLPYLVRARAFHEQGDDIEAIEDLSAAINAVPKYAPAFNSRAWYEIIMGRMKQALADADEAVRLDPEMAPSLDTRGVIYFCMDKYKEALADFDRGIDLKPDYAANYYHRAMIFERTGRKDEAEKDRQKARQLDYKPEPWELRIQGLK